MHQSQNSVIWDICVMHAPHLFVLILLIIHVSFDCYVMFSMILKVIKENIFG